MQQSSDSKPLDLGAERILCLDDALLRNAFVQALLGYGLDIQACAAP